MEVYVVTETNYEYNDNYHYPSEGVRLQETAYKSESKARVRAKELERGQFRGMTLGDWGEDLDSITEMNWNDFKAVLIAVGIEIENDEDQYAWQGVTIPNTLTDEQVDKISSACDRLTFFDVEKVELDSDDIEQDEAPPEEDAPEDGPAELKTSKTLQDEQKRIELRLYEISNLPADKRPKGEAVKLVCRWNQLTGQEYPMSMRFGMLKEKR